MRIHLHQHSREWVRPVFAPNICPSQEEALLCRETIDGRGFFPGQQAHHSHVRNAHAAIVGNVLAQRQLAIHLQVVDRGEPRVLIGHARGALVELLAILFGPPVAQVSLRIEFAAFIVETMSQLVSDHGANAAKVHCVVRLVVIERRLQNSRRKRDVVQS